MNVLHQISKQISIAIHRSFLFYAPKYNGMKWTQVLVGVLFCVTTFVNAQNWTEMGKKQFEALAYSQAIISFEKAVKMGAKDTQMYGQLAESYYHNANYRAAAKWYTLYFKTKEGYPQKHYFQYAQSLKSIGKQEEANRILQQMNQRFGSNLGKILEAKPSENHDINSNDAKRYEIQLVAFNSEASDFGTAFFGNQIVFASARDTSGFFKKTHTWTNQSFTDLFSVNPDSLQEIPILFSKEINSKFNESTCVFTKDGQTMYFTRNNFDGKNRGFDTTNTTLLKIYKAIRIGQNWNVVGALPFCNDAFNLAHPTLSHDEKTLYFASDMPGGFGLSDIYKVAIFPDGSFGVPENLGDKINTMGRETFPFITPNQVLYFSSDGHENWGGLDIFASFWTENNTWRTPQNLGQPVNSQMDDFGFVLNETTKKGFLTSNRLGGKGLDDIYSFTELLPLPCKNRVEGTLVFDETNTFAEGIQITIESKNGNTKMVTITEKQGNFSFDIKCNETYTVKAVADGYLPLQIEVKAQFASTISVGTNQLKKQKVPFQVGDDLAVKLGLSPIYFDLRKAEIRSDAAAELVKIKNTLLENPTLHIEIRSHTDSRDTKPNNQKLSNQRALATMNWLIQNGIQADRLNCKGFGETALLNECSDNVNCSETDHQINRRSEFIVTDF